MAFPAKVNYSGGSKLYATDLNDGFATLNLLAPSAKGDLFVGTGSNAGTKLSVGSNNQILTADSTATSGVKWAAVSVPTNALLVAPKETINIVASAPTATTNFDVITAGVWYYTVTTSAVNFTINFRGSSSATLDSLLSVGQSISVVLLNTNGASAFYATAITVDGSAPAALKWQSAAPTAGNANAIDSYAATIIKTASATFTVLASQTKFA